MATRLYLPGDAASVALGADEICGALMLEAAKRGAHIEIIRNGSRGLFSIEPLLEVQTPAGRIGYGPVSAGDVPALFDAGLMTGGDHPLRLGRPEDLPFFARQTRLTFARCGVTDPYSLDDYRGMGGLKGYARAQALGPEATVAEVLASGLRGRGGGGFPAGVKWKTVADTPPQQKFIVCNADEGDSGTFADRMIMEGDPFLLLEGMAIAGLAVGADKGIIYVRSEYPHAIAALQRAIAIAQAQALFAIDIEVRVGAGAYVCGEETALLESIEGKRGLVRAKPPLPAHKGLFQQPTIINNVLTLCAVPHILADGAGAYQAFGMGRSRGTMPVQLAGNVRHGGLFETAFGITLAELVEEIGGGTESGRPIKAVQVGGPLGAYLHPSQFDIPFDYEAFTAKDALVGHGGVVVFDDTVDMARMARFAMEFCAVESCGKCTPCRIGSVRGKETLDKVLLARAGGGDTSAAVALVADLCQTMKLGSLCALGGFTPYPVMSALTHFPEDFGVRAPLAAE